MRDKAVHRAESGQMSQGRAQCLTQCREAVTACTTTSLFSQPVVNLVASLGNLTKLHLTLDERRQDRSQLQPLDRLCFLQDLALQCVHAQCCHGVLHSSRHSLLSVDLAAKSWSPQTYKHLQVTPNIEFVGISIQEFDHEEACDLAGITAASFCLSLDGLWPQSGQIQPILANLSQCKPQFHELTIWGPRDDLFEDLHLPALKKLTLCWSIMGIKSRTYRNGWEYLFSGLKMKPHPNVTELVFAGTRVLTAPGLGHILTHSLPALTKMSFCETQLDSTGVTLPQDCLRVLRKGQRLKLIDLRGVRGLTDASLSMLCHAFHYRQAQDQAQPLVKLLLPATPLGTAQAVMQWVSEACVHRLCLLDNSSKCCMVVKPSAALEAVPMYTPYSE